MSKRINKSPLLELRRRRIKKAFPAVRNVVRRHGLNIVNACVLQMKEVESKRREYDEKKSELSTLESEIKNL